MTVHPFQNLLPCVDEQGHRFTTNQVPAGQFGTAFIYCTRCGLHRSELEI